METASYYSQINPDLLNNIPINSSKILELGCGTGALGAAFKARSAHVRYTGVELSKTASEIAAKNLDQVFNIDINKLSTDLLDNSYDYHIWGH